MDLNLTLMQVNHLPLAGRLRHCSINWEKITTDSWVLETVRGLRLNFVSPPVQTVFPQEASLSGDDRSLVTLEIQELLQKGANSPGSPVTRDSGVSQFPLFSSKKRGWSETCSKLEALNQFLPYEHFKMEGIHMVRDLLRKRDFMIKIDLKDAYFTVPLCEEHQKFVRFNWEGTLYEFACLPFGLSIAPRVFTKILKPVVALLRQLGIRLIIYLDDLLIMAQSKENLNCHASTTLHLLENLGFMINYLKSVLIPATKMEFLGFLIDCQTMTLALPRDKVRKVKKECQSALNHPQITVRELAKVLGNLTSTIQAVFPGPLHFRHLQGDKNKALVHLGSYDSLVQLSPQALEELIWWRDNLDAWNGKSLISGSPDLITETDASRRGWGAFCMGVATGGPWSKGESQLHINCLKLLAGAFAIQTFARSKAQMKVRLLMDNVSAAHYINRMGGTKSPVLARLAIDLWEWCLQQKIQVEAQYLPGVLNIRADRESRVMLDLHDWKLDPLVFSGLPHFYSWRPDPQAEAVDAFSQDWSSVKGYAFPPFALIGRCLKKILDHQVSFLVLVAPVWQAQPWYPLLLEMCVAPPVLLPQYPGLVTRLGEVHPLSNLQLAGWLLSSNPTLRREFQKGLKTSWLQPGGRGPHQPIHQLGESGIAGAVNGKLIQFMPQ